jgi:hypothetical protein
MPGGNLGAQREVELAEPAPLAPVAQQEADWRLTGSGFGNRAHGHHGAGRSELGDGRDDALGHQVERPQ